MANCWLLKTEPSAYSFAQLARDTQTVWDGVKNPQALKNLAQIAKGDELLIYHTGNEKAVVGNATAVTAAYVDPRHGDPKLLVIELKAGSALARPVRLAEMKSSAKFAGWDLVRLPRLSVMAVPSALRREIERLSHT